MISGSSSVAADNIRCLFVRGVVRSVNASGVLTFGVAMIWGIEIHHLDETSCSGPAIVDGSEARIRTRR